MPNLWVAFGVVAAVSGFLCLAADRTDRRAMAALAIGLGAVALVRPSDAVWSAATLLVMAVSGPAWRAQPRR